MKSDDNKRLITLTVITLSSFYCTLIDWTQLWKLQPPKTSPKSTKDVKITKISALLGSISSTFSPDFFTRTEWGAFFGAQIWQTANGVWQKLGEIDPSSTIFCFYLSKPRLFILMLWEQRQQQLKRRNSYVNNNISNNNSNTNNTDLSDRYHNLKNVNNKILTNSLLFAVAMMKLRWRLMWSLLRYMFSLWSL